MDAITETSTMRPRRLPRGVRTTLWTVVWLVTLLVLAVVIENWLGAREWKKYLEEAAAAGESVELAAVVPAPAADAENFAAIPLFKPLFDYERARPERNEFVGHPTWRDPAGKERLENLNQKAFGNAALHGTGNWRLGTAIDLGVWQEKLREAFPAELSGPAKPGEDVLRVLARFDGDLAALRDAAPRPRSRFPIRYEEHIAVPMGHLNALLGFGKIARARALAHLALGNAEAAAGDLLLGLRIAEATTEEPLLISQLVVSSQIENQMQPLWEGLQRKQWSEAQLAQIEAALARLDLVSGYQRGVRGERIILGVQALETLKTMPELLFSVFQGGSNRESPFFTRVGRFFLPSGWVDFNKAELCRYYDRQVRVVRPEEHRFDAAATLAQEKRYTQGTDAERGNPRKMIAALVPPQLALLQQRCAAGQATVDLARVAVAIERHRLKHGAVPAQLDALTPGFLRTLPQDVMSGEHLRYRIGPDGKSELYSVGWNGTDDGGAHALKVDAKPVEIDWGNGDWPWPQPARFPGAE